MNLNRRRAEWAGFRYGKYDLVSSLSSELTSVLDGWLSPEAGPEEPWEDKYFSQELPDFPNNIVACLKWLVPELQKEHTISIDDHYGPGEWNVVVETEPDEEPEDYDIGAPTSLTWSAQADTIAKAICGVVDKVIEAAQEEVKE